MKEEFIADYWHSIDDKKIQCDLCPHGCTLEHEQNGLCSGRGNISGKMVLHTFNHPVGLSIDPVEKKPLYHFFPGSPIMSFGTIGCNLTCKFCQNHHLSRAKTVNKFEPSITPEQIINEYKSRGVDLIAFTYNEPIVFFEYAREVAKLAKQEVIKSVAVSAGFINEEPRKEFFSFIDATNIDLKSFSNDFYRKYTGGDLQTVLDTLLYIKNETNVWLEITTLIIPGLNDSEEELDNLCTWIADNLGSNVPIHFSAFHPMHELKDRERTPLKTLQKAKKIAQSKGIKHIYLGNAHDFKNSATYCPNCKKQVIQRDHFSVGKINVTKDGKCKYCSQVIPGNF